MNLSQGRELICKECGKPFYSFRVNVRLCRVCGRSRLHEMGIDPEEINEYLVALARDPKSPSRSSFKHMVYGLRYYYRLLGMNKNAIALPSQPCLNNV